MKQFLTAMRKPTSQIGKLFDICVSWLQRQAGIRNSIFKNTTIPLPHVESKWFLSLRQYLHASSTWIELAETHLLPPQRLNDFHLMHAVLLSKSFTPKQIKRINYCRLFLQVEMASDICLADGRTIDPTFLHGKPSLLSSRSLLRSVHQPCPHQKSWRYWRKANKLWSKKGIMSRPLGAWTIPLRQRIRRWPAYFHSPDRTLYIYSHADKLFHLYGMQTILCSTETHHSSRTSLPAQAYPVDVTSTDSGWKLLPQTYPLPSVVTSMPTVHCFQTHLLTRPTWEQNLLRNLQLTLPLTTLLETLETVTVASDGSHLEEINVGAYGWVVGTRTDIYVECFGITPSSVHGSSYRSEAAGVLSLTVFLDNLESSSSESITYPSWSYYVTTMEYVRSSMTAPTNSFRL